MKREYSVLEEKELAPFDMGFCYVSCFGVDGLSNNPFPEGSPKWGQWHDGGMASINKYYS